MGVRSIHKCRVRLLVDGEIDSMIFVDDHRSRLFGGMGPWLAMSFGSWFSSGKKLDKK